MREEITLKLALIFFGSSLLATLFLYLRQPIILAYIALGVAIGPWGGRLIEDPFVIEQISHLGIILLMFLIGLHLHLQKLYKLLREAALVTIATCLSFAASFMLVVRAFGFPWGEGLIVGLALMFSSTVITLKLTPTTTLHHRHLGEVLISILLLQDIIAILIILFLTGFTQEVFWQQAIILLLKGIAIAIASVLAVSFLLLKAFQRFDVIQDYIFLVSLGWCLLVAAAARLLGLSYEIGAFLAGIALGASPIALVIAEGLKPVREFFLILFFFSIGAKFNLLVTQQVIIPALALAAICLGAKPLLFSQTFRLAGKTTPMSHELGLRLGQASEFSLLVAYAAFAGGWIEARTSFLIQLTTIITFICSTYLVVFSYPTPIAISDRMRQD